MAVTSTLDYPPYKVARFFLRSGAESRAITLTATQLDDPQNPFTQLFVLANETMQFMDQVKSEAQRRGQLGTFTIKDA